MNSIKSLISTPKYAAGVAAVLGLIAKYFDYRLSNTKATFMGYIKAAGWSAALGWLFVYLLIDNNQRGGSNNYNNYNPVSRFSPPRQMPDFYNGGTAF